MQAPKNGYFYVLDRKTGKFISGAPLQKITWAKGLDPKTGRPIINPEAHFGTTPVICLAGSRRRTRLAGHVVQSPNAISSTSRPEWPPAFPTFRRAEFKPELGAYNWGIIFRDAAGRGTGPVAAAPTARHVHRRLRQRRRLEISFSHGIPRRKRNAGALPQPVAAAR